MDAQHPSDSTLRSFHLGQLDAMLAAAVAGHLSTCSDCRSRMSGIPSESLPRGVQSPRSGSDLPAAIGSSLTGLHVPTAAGSAQPTQPDPVLDALLSHPDYRVIRELGRGGMGVVYLAENRLMGRKEVLKVVSADVLERNGVLDRFLREIRMAAMLQHRNIVTAFSAVVACLNNTGPGLDAVGPATNYSVLTDFQTWVCTFAMVLGRLEIFTLLVVLTPAFWRK